MAAKSWIWRIRVFLISTTSTGWVQTLLRYLWTRALLSITEVDLVYLAIALVLKHPKFLIDYAMSHTCALLTFLHIFLVRHFSNRGCYSDIVVHVGRNPKSVDNFLRFLRYILHHLWRVPTPCTSLLNISCILTRPMAIGHECCETTHIGLIQLTEQTAVSAFDEILVIGKSSQGLRGWILRRPSRYYEIGILLLLLLFILWLLLNLPVCELILKFLLFSFFFLLFEYFSFDGQSIKILQINQGSHDQIDLLFFVQIEVQGRQLGHRLQCFNHIDEFVLL